MASRALKTAKNSSSLADPRHLMRFLKSQANMTNEEIAKSEGVTVDTIKKSVYLVESYRKRNTTFEMDLAVRDLVISSMPQAKETLQGLLTATELVERKDEKTGKTKVVAVEDKITRLEALKVVRTFVSDLQPKSAPVEVNVSQTNQTANISQAETNEERFRRLRKQVEEHNMLPPEVAGVPDHIDSGEDEDEEEEDDEDVDDEED